MKEEGMLYEGERRDEVIEYTRRLSELTDTCPHCEAPLHPCCLCWSPDDEEWDDE